jgi:hypothetical protein
VIVGGLFEDGNPSTNLVLSFGRAFWAGFYLIGIVLIGGALADAITGLAGGSAADIRAVTG